MAGPAGGGPLQGGTRKKKALAGLVVLLMVGGLTAAIVLGIGRKSGVSNKNGSTPVASVPQATAKDQSIQSDSAPAVTESKDTAKPSTTTTAPAIPAPDKADGSVANLPTTAANLPTTTANLPTTAANLPTTGELAAFISDIGKGAQGNLTSNLTSNAKQVLEAGGFGNACAPADGPALVKAISSGCTYVSLRPNGTYAIGKSTLNITTTVVIVGNPAFPPLVDGSKAQRAFHVMEGGYLQLSFATIYRGNEYKSPNAYFILIRGGSALIDAGGGASFVGVTFSQPLPQQPDLKVNMMIGGHILQTGGEVFLTGCTFLNLSPYNIRAAIWWGGDILIVSGVLVETATNHLQIALILAGTGSSLFVHILGGVGIFTGSTFSRALGMGAAAGAGIQVGIPAGIGIFTGCTFVTNGGIFAFFGAGVHQFVGSGVLINTGVTTNLNLGIAYGAGVGPLVAIGSGIFVHTGGAFVVDAGMKFAAFSGAMGFIGPGSATVTGVNFARNFGMLSGYGLGGQLGCQSGAVTITGCPSSLNAGLVSAWLLGHQFWLGSGVLTEVGVPSARMVGLTYRGGQGNHAWVGSGALTVIGSPDFAKSKGYAPTGQTKFWIHGKTSKTGAPGTFARRGLVAGGTQNRVTLADLQLSDVENGKEKCEAALGFEQGAQVDVCVYKNVTLVGCNATSPVVSGAAPGVCVEDPKLDTASVLNNLRTEHATRRLAEVKGGKAATYVIRADVMLACPSEAQCPNATTLKSVISDYLTSALGPSASATLRLSAAAKETDARLKDLYKPTDTTSGLDNCPFAAPLAVFAVLDDRETFENVRSLLGAMNDGAANAQVTEALRRQSPGLCVLVSDVGFSYVVPILPEVSGAKDMPKTTGKSIAPAVTIKDATTGQVVESVTAGRRYILEAVNFPSKASVTFSLHDGEDLTAPVESLGAASTGQLDWTPSSVMLSRLNSAYFTVNSAMWPTVIGYSPLIDVMSA